MKKLLLHFILITLLISCSQTEKINAQNNKVILLQIDFVTNQFEGGKEISFQATDANFTISSTYQAPGDFGSVQLYYEELNEKIFDGTIIWSGLGEMNYPEIIDAPSIFTTIFPPLALPNTNKFENVMYSEGAYYPDDIKYAEIWEAINQLEVTANYLNSNPNGKIHLFLYTPSVGLGNPSDWNWFVILKN